MRTRTLSMAAGLFFAAQGAFAMPYAETGDAPDLIPGQTVAGGTTSITGFGGAGDVDMYGFNWGGGALQIDTFSAFTSFDTQLFLFDSAGFGVLGNDDHFGICAGTPSSGLQSCLDLTGGLAAGSYYLGISTFNNDPLDGANTPMMSCISSAQCASVGGPLASWSGASTNAGESGYTINFSSATASSTAIPEPGILLLLGLGLAGLGFARRRA